MTRTVMTRIWSATTDDPAPIVVEIRRKIESFKSSMDRVPSRIYLGTNQIKSLSKQTDLWKIEQGPEGESRARLLGLLCFNLKIDSHIHVSYSNRDNK